jgi:anti-sigma factor RsiW
MAPRFHLSPEELASYIDGRASRPEWKRIVGHLATCDACFRELAAVLQLMKNQRSAPGEPP